VTQLPVDATPFYDENRSAIICHALCFAGLSPLHPPPLQRSRYFCLSDTAVGLVILLCLVSNIGVTNQCFFKIRDIANFEKTSTQRRVEVLLTVLLIALGERFQAWGNAPLFSPSAEGKFPFLGCGTDV